MKSTIMHIVALSSILVVMFMPEIGRSQGQKDAQKDSAQSIALSNTSTNERIVLPLGQLVMYKLHSSEDYVSGKIVGGSDSTISFEDKNKVVVNVPHKELHILKIPRTKSRKTFGTIVTVIGSVAVFAGIVSVVTPKAESDASGVDEGLHDAGAIIGAIGLPVLAAGLALKSARKINFEKLPWKLNAGLASENPLQPRNEYHKFKIGFTVGLATGSAIQPTFMFAAEPSYRISKAWAIGLRFEDVTLNGSQSAGTTYSGDGLSYTLTIQHYFIGDKIIPFVGAGLGVYTGFGTALTAIPGSSLYTQNSSDFGFYPRAGFEVGHLTMSAEYNVISGFNYFSLKAGVIVGGGRTVTRH